MGRGLFIAAILLVSAGAAFCDNNNNQKPDSPPPTTNPSTPPSDGYVPIGNQVLSADAKLLCTCQGAGTRIRPVCGNNNQTYLSACQLAGAIQQFPTGLGLRCRGACPCPDLAAQAAKAGACIPTTVARKRPKWMVDNPVKRFCMTGNVEATRATAYCLMAKDKSLGVRCMGTCSECPTYNCPARLLVNIPMWDDTKYITAT